MKVLRKIEVETDNFEIGDQITINLKTFGNFTATVQEVTDKEVLFMFDKCVTERKMNQANTTEGGYEKSELYGWLNNEFIDDFPNDIRQKIKEISLPSYSQLFGNVKNYLFEFIKGTDAQFPLMKERKDRAADSISGYWLRDVVSSMSFAFVGYNGHATYNGVSTSTGVRPIFIYDLTKGETK